MARNLIRFVALAALALCVSAPAFAQATYPTASGPRVQGVVPLACDTNGANCAPTTASPTSTAVSSVTGSVSGVTVTSSSAQALAAGSRRLLALHNPSPTATLSCAFGVAAVLNAANTFTIPPLSTVAWVSYPVPADAVNCISSAASSPLTIEVN